MNENMRSLSRIIEQATEGAAASIRAAVEEVVDKLDTDVECSGCAKSLDLEENSIYCQECYEKVSATCKRCGTNSDSTDFFCTDCVYDAVKLVLANMAADNIDDQIDAALKPEGQSGLPLVVTVKKLLEKYNQAMEKQQRHISDIINLQNMNKELAKRGIEKDVIISELTKAKVPADGSTPA